MGCRAKYKQYLVVPSDVGFEGVGQVGRAAIRPPRLADVLDLNFGWEAAILAGFCEVGSLFYVTYIVSQVLLLFQRACERLLCGLRFIG